MTPAAGRDPRPASSDVPIFDGEFLKKLEYLHIVSKRVFEGQFRAERRSRTRGAGLEFADHRGYTPGDDFRHVDWKAYQRLGRLLLRLFEEEQDLPVYIFVDHSRSMGQGSPSKLLHGQRIAAALCYVGLANLDRVTLVAYGTRLTAELRSQRGKGQILNVFGFLRELAPAGDTDARAAFRQFVSTKRQRGVAVVISDFMDPNGFEPGLDVLRNFQHDLFCVHVVTPDEANPTLRGDVRLVDAETGDVHDVAITPSLLATYQRVFDTFCSELTGYCGRYRFGYLRTESDVPFEDVILQTFRQGRFLA